MPNKLTPTERRILKVLASKPMDVFDLVDELRLSHGIVFPTCVVLRDAGLIDWMYTDDQAALSDAGHLALSDSKENGK